MTASAAERMLQSYSFPATYDMQSNSEYRTPRTAFNGYFLCTGLCMKKNSGIYSIPEHNPCGRWDLNPQNILFFLARYFSVFYCKTTQFSENSLTSHHLLLDFLIISNLARKVKDFLKILHMDKRHWFGQNRNKKKLDS